MNKNGKIKELKYFANEMYKKDIIVKSVKNKYINYINAIANPLDAVVREWVAVEDKLPETNSDVLILTNYGKMATAYINDPEHPTYGWTDAMRPEHGYGSVTHWMELPSKPSA